jgi:hypothetical protein
VPQNAGTVADTPVAEEASLGIVKWRWKRRSSGFSTITLPDGNQVLADDETRKFFEDKDHPDPSNESLSQLWREVARVRIFDGGMSEGKPLGHTVLLDVTNAERRRSCSSDWQLSSPLSVSTACATGTRP